MPVRDAAEWLAEAIASIRAQTFTDWELIAVDDGSRDATPAILAELRPPDARIHVLATSAADRGLVAALNCGLRVARGELVARMDADDIARPERLAAQIALLASDPSLTAVTSLVEAFPEQQLGEGMRRYVA